MILKIRNTEKNLTKLDLITISFVLAYFGALFYPHQAIGGGVLLEGTTIIELLLFSAFALFATARLSSRQPLLEKSPLSRPLAALTVLIFVTSFFAQNRPLALEATFLYLAYLCCFFIFLTLLKENNQQVSLVYIILLLTLVLCCYGLMDYYFFNRNPRLHTVWRLRSTFGNSNQMAGFLAMTIPLFVGVMLSKEFPKSVVLFLYLVLFIMLSTLLLTYARSGWISTVAGIGLVLIVHSATSKKINLKKNILPALSLVCILLILFFSSTNLVNRLKTMTQEDTEVTLYGRELAWQGTLKMIKTYPFKGVGPGNYSKAFRTFQPPGLSKPYFYAHSDYLQFVSETGILLIPVILWLLFSLFAHGLSKIRQVDHQIRGIVLGAMGGIGALLVYSASDFNLHIPANALLFTILAAIVAAPVSIKKNLITTETQPSLNSGITSLGFKRFQLFK